MTAIGAETKLEPSWLVGPRDGDAARAFTPADHAWLARQVAAGRFPSLEAALSAGIAELKAHESAPGFAWAKPLVDASRAAIARGEGVPLDDAFKHWDATLARLRR